MKKSYIFSLLAVAAMLTGCSKENPFGDAGGGEGQFLKSALSVDIKADALQRDKAMTRAEANPDDFTVIFTREGNPQPVAKYKYGEMPEIVTLPEGKYTCTATYGELRLAEWESPYFLGTSEEFEILPFEITSYVEPIECCLENIKVTIDFDSSLRRAMSSDSYVDVKVGSSTSLKYTLTEADSGKAGYFAHSEETTLVATFNGTIDGEYTVESKSLRNIAKGNHYRITFRLHNGGGSNSDGDVDSDVTVDANVTVVDVTCDVPLGEEPLLDDSERPGENPGEDPGTPEEPVNNPPLITPVAPVSFDVVNDANSLASCILDIHSDADGGILAFTCDIESPTLTPDELKSVNLSDHLDFVNTPPELEEALTGLGFPVNIGGQKDVRFDITKFLPMLSMLGSAEHHFTLTVTDANGTTVRTLKLKS